MVRGLACRTVFVRLAALLTVCLGSACASAGSASSARCRSDLGPDSIPLAQLLDSAATQVALTEVWAPASGLVIGRLRFDSTGAFDSAAVYTEGLGAAAVADIGRVLAGAVVGESPDRPAVSLFIGDEHGPALRGTAPFRTCAPRIADARILQKRIAEEAPGLSLPLGGTRRTEMFVFVRASGGVGEVRIDRSSGDPLADAAASRVFRTALFEPARVEGIPIPVWVSFPVTFRSPRQ